MKPKLSNRIIALLLCFSMVCAFALPARPLRVRAADQVYAWNNGSIVDYVHYTGEKNYLDDAPFGYAYFYQGTNPSDTRAAGFYDMILAVNGGNSWFKNRYYCGATDAETTYDGRTAAIHLAAQTWPTYHYSTGYVFTAPYTGTVEFTYQYACVNNNALNWPFYVMRETAAGYGDALQKFTTAKLADVNDKTASEYDEAVFTVDVTAGEKIYFVADSDASNRAFGHWISSARYLAVVESMHTDKETYIEGDSITVTTTTSGGGFGPNDYIAILADGETSPSAKQAAAACVTFTDALPAGKYQVVVVIDGITGNAASATIQIAPPMTPWDNGSIVDYVYYTGEKNYLDDAPFGYAYFYQGTEPNDSRATGFYDMILAVNGGNSWFKGRYYCGETDAETEYNARTAAIHLAAQTYPTYHYSTGYVFTAPYTGIVEFTYQYAYVGSAHGKPFYVMRETAAGYADALKTFTTTKIADVNDKSVSQYDEATFAVKVTAGEKIYFLADSDASNKAFAHWISSACYKEYGPHLEHRCNAWSVDPDDTAMHIGTCEICGETVRKERTPEFCEKSISLKDSFAINFYVEKDLFTEGYYQDPYVVFACNGEQTTAYAYKERDNYYIFTYDNVAAAMMNEVVTATLYATDKDGTAYTASASCSVAEYCYTVLGMEDTADTLRTLLVDTLNFGAVSQLYFDSSTAAQELANASLTDEQRAWGTSGELRALKSCRDFGDNKGYAVKWYGVSALMGNAIKMRVYFIADDRTELTIKATSARGEWLLGADDIKTKNGICYVDFGYLNPAQMDEQISFTVYEGETAVSSTLHYSIESYAAVWMGKQGARPEQTELVKAIIRYGDAVKAYVNYLYGMQEESTAIESSALLSLIREGTIRENGDYTVTDSNGFTFDSADDGKVYDLKNAVIRISVPEEDSAITVQANGMTLKNGSFAIYGGTALTVDGSKDTVLSNLHFCGDAQAAVRLGGSGGTVTDCVFKPDADGALLQGIVATGSDIAVTNSSFTGLGEGIVDQSENGVVAEANTFENCGVGVSVQTSGTTVWHNEFSGGDCAVSAAFEKSELSAAESDGYNLLIAGNRITGAKTSVICRNASNSVVLLNTMETACIEGNTNIYVCENTLSGQLTVNANNYLICNQNTVGQLTAQDNQNVNGDNVTDLSARAEVGANEELLPHINTEQFAGMQKRELRTADGAVKLNRYIEKRAENGAVVIVPPGRYEGTQLELTGLEDVTVYAYGVYNEVDSTDGYAVKLTGCTDCTIHGMFLGYQSHPHIQGTIVELAEDNETVIFRPDPGYIQDYSAMGVVEGRLFNADGINFGLVRYSEKSYDSITGLNTLVGCTLWGDVAPGDRIAFRSSYVAGGFSFNKCSEISMEDVTVFNCASFAESDSDNEIAPVLHRYAVTQGPAPVLEGTAEDYDSDLVYTDSYGRTRSAAPLLTTLDGTHSTNARTGIQIVSCLFEGLDDDMTNINGLYGLAEDYDETQHTLTYGLSDVNGYQRLPATFRVGDQLEMFTLDGQHIASVAVESATTQLTGDHYALTLPEDFTLTAEQTDLIRSGKVVVQNRTATGNGFLIDNTKIHNIVGRMLLKGGPGVVKNCTLQGMGYNAIVAQVEVNTWPEVGYVHDVQILNNLFDNNNARTTISDTWLQAGNMVDIQIIGTSGSTSITAAKDCMNTNILISGNVFQNRYANYAIRVNAVSNLTISNNTFLPKYGETADSDTNVPVLIIGGNGIVLEDNTYPKNVSAVAENRFNIPGITGNNVP